MKHIVILVVLASVILGGINAAQAIPEDRMFLGVYDPSGAFADSAMDVEMEYFDWVDSAPMGTFIQETVGLGRTPILSIEPFTTSGSNVLLDTSSGLNDPYLDGIVSVLNETESEVWIRWAQEPELTGLYPWSQGLPERYEPAYIYVVEYLRRNTTAPERLKFIYAPAGNLSGTYYYPGDNWVDMISLTVLSDYIWDTVNLGNAEPQPFRAFIEGKYLHYVQFGKPIYIGEMGISRETEEQRQQWLDQAMVELQSGNWPLMVGIVYFNARNAENIWTDRLPDWSVAPENFWTPEEMPSLTPLGE